MDIVMLGHSSAGKTTYLSLMYQAMQRGVDGFGMRSTDPEQHRRLLRNAEAIMMSTYPPLSDVRSIYDLVLTHHGGDVFAFRWRDYRGGALTEHSSSPQAAELHADLTAADAIVLFSDAQGLTAGPRAGRKVRALTTHVHRALDARGEVMTPLVVALTKCDLVDLDDQRVLDALYEPFQPLIEAVAATKHVFGTVVPLVCGPRPVNVVAPVLWALHWGVLGRAKALHESIESNIEASRDAASRDTVWDRLSSWWNSETSYAEISRRRMSDAASEYQQLEPLIEPVERLRTVIEDMPCF